MSWLTERTPRLPKPADYPARSHSPAVAARVGLVLGVTFSLCFVTGLISHLIQHPPSWFGWPTSPVWLYRLNQGIHVSSGLISIPLLIIKLWVVTPRFWRRPLLTGVVNVAERMSILVLIAAAAFELISGLFNVAEFYPWAFFFPPVHHAVAWITVGALLVHVAVKLPVIRAALTRSVDTPDDAADGDNPADTAGATTTEPAAAPEPVPGGLLMSVAQTREKLVTQTATRAPAGISRRGLLWVGAGAATIVTAATIGDRIPALQGISALAQRSGDGPQGLPVNRSARAAGITRAAVGPEWRLVVAGPGGTLAFSLEQLTAMQQITAELPIACVEGWARSATWSGVRLSTLIAAAGATESSGARLLSLDGGTYGRSVVPPNVCAAPDTLVALTLNGADLDPDHGYPARLISPARPGVLQTKWLRRIEVTS